MDARNRAGWFVSDIGEKLNSDGMLLAVWRSLKTLTHRGTRGDGILDGKRMNENNRTAYIKSQ